MYCFSLTRVSQCGAPNRPVQGGTRAHVALKPCRVSIISLSSRSVLEGKSALIVASCFCHVSLEMRDVREWPGPPWKRNVAC